MWFCSFPLLPNSIPWLVHSLGQHPAGASSFRPAGSESPNTDKKHSPTVESLSYFGSHYPLMAVIIPPSSHIPPAHSSRAAATVGSTICFDCWLCLLVPLSGRRGKGGWSVSHQMHVMLIQLWTAVHVLVVKWGTALYWWFIYYLCAVHMLGCRGQRKCMHCMQLCKIVGGCIIIMYDLKFGVMFSFQYA